MTNKRFLKDIEEIHKNHKLFKPKEEISTKKVDTPKVEVKPVEVTKTAKKDNRTFAEKMQEISAAIEKMKPKASTAPKVESNGLPTATKSKSNAKAMQEISKEEREWFDYTLGFLNKFCGTDFHPKGDYTSMIEVCKFFEDLEDSAGEQLGENYRNKVGSAKIIEQLEDNLFLSKSKNDEFAKREKFLLGKLQANNIKI